MGRKYNITIPSYRRSGNSVFAILSETEVLAFEHCNQKGDALRIARYKTRVKTIKVYRQGSTITKEEFLRFGKSLVQEKLGDLSKTLKLE